MITKVEVYRDGHREVYHRTDGGQKAWTHAVGAPCEVCHKTAGQRPSATVVNTSEQRPGQKAALSAPLTKSEPFDPAA